MKQRDWKKYCCINRQNGEEIRDMMRIRRANCTLPSGADAFMYIGLLISIVYAFLPLVRVVPDVLKYIIRGIPLLCCMVATLKRSSLNLWCRLLIIIIFSIFNALIRVYANANGIDADTDFLMFTVVAICYWLTLYEGEYVSKYYDSMFAGKIIRLILGLLTFSCLTTIIGNLIFPEITRASASSSEAINYWYNIGSYGFCYAAGFLIPTVVILIRTKIISRKCYVVVLLLFLVPIVCQFFTSIVISIIGLTMTMVNPKYYKRLIIIVVFFCFLCLCIPLSVWGSLLQIVANVIASLGNEILYERIDGLAQLLSTGVTYGDAHARFALYEMSLTHFIKNPILGLIGEKGFVRMHPTPYDLIWLGDGADVSVGRHSDFIDLIGGGGLVGFIPFALLLTNHFRKFAKIFRNSATKTLLLILIMQYVVYGIVDHAFSNYEVAFSVFVVPVFAGLLIMKREECL